MAGRGAIWLVGMMGAGKSTVGPVLAVRLGRPFVDTDDEVRGVAGKDIPEIFAEAGESAFRALESQVIEAAGADGAVVALGGGAIVQPGALARLASRGTIVYLRARAETLLERIGDPASRPLLAGLDEAERLEQIQQLLEERRSAYQSAPVVIDVDDWDTAAIAVEIEAALAASQEQSGER